MKVEIEALDHFGYGITHVNGKVVFVDNALPEEIVKIEIYEDKKSFAKARVLEYIKKSDLRVKPICPYFGSCGGCSLMFYDYEKTIEYKKNKVLELLKKNKILFNFNNKDNDNKHDNDNNITVIENKEPLGYRNKISLKIIDGKIGYYEAKTHTLVEIKECVVASTEINKVIANYKLLGIKNGNLTIRTNTNKEILLVIESNEEQFNIEITKLKEQVKLVGIVYNNKTIYGDNFFYERIGGFLFKVSFNSFFQVNHYICNELFKLVKNEINEDDIILDLYSGVGTFSIVASEKAKRVISVEIIKNAVLNGIFNGKINKRDNIEFLLGDTSKVVSKIKDNFDTIIIDPPRSGIEKKTMDFIKEKLPSKIIYISCDISTLMRDLKILEDNYEIKTFTMLDMFSYSYHMENMCVLKKR